MWLKIFPVLFFSFLVSFTLPAKEKIPDDIRYMLEDMYGADKSKWPPVRIRKDLNNDSFPDWLIHYNCQEKNICPAEIFLCSADKKGNCEEYCYKSTKNLKMLEETIANGKCETTC